MPGRNIVKIFEADAFYHLYNRGINRSDVFLDGEDYRYFEWLLERHVSPVPCKDSKGREYIWLREAVELNAYCLMPNHFHLLAYQCEVDGITKLMRSICTAYTMYFNKKYKRRGPLFENSYRAVPIWQDSQLLHISRYIHLNHKDFRVWPHSSFNDYLAGSRSWVTLERIKDLFKSDREYRDFVLDYEDAQRSLDAIKRDLAGY